MIRLPLSVAEPALLLLGVVVLALTLAVSVAARHHLSVGRRRLSLLLRSVIVGALVLAVAGLRLELPVERLTTVFLVDLSDSVGAAGRDQALSYLRTAIAQRPAGDQAAIVAFGSDAVVERLPAELVGVDRLASVPVRSATDVGGALRLASALFPDGTRRRLVLLSDGNDTTGRGQSEAAVAGAAGIPIDTLVIGRSGDAEVMMASLQAPATARVGDDLEVVATVVSTVAQPATVRLYGDGVPVGSPQRVDLAEGATRVTFTVSATEAGFHVFRAVVEAAQDTFRQNDRADADTVVKGEPRVLLVADDPATASALRDALTAQRHQVDEVGPEGVPADLAGLASYDAVVLADVPAERLGQATMTSLQSYVRDLGRGLVMVGGEGSYGAGGYARTPIEATLPVDMDVRDRNRQPDVALVVVIDESGSMDACHCNTANRDRGVAIQGIPKVDIGKEAILRAASALTERDELGVVAFNEGAHWVIRTAPLGQAGDVEARIAGIKADGQTNILAGLTAAVDSLEDVQAERRHIVLLTDGWSSSGQYDELLERMQAAGITLSAVGAGGGGASAFLESLAERGGGRYWAAQDASSIPDIFLRETQVASGQRIVEEPFFPVQTSDSPILAGLGDGFPQLLGYNGSTLKPAAQSVLVTGRDDPLLAQWQYGLGRAVAWTSDATGRWARDWLGWDGFGRFFAQAVAWTFPGEESDGIEASFVADGDATRLQVRSTDEDGSPRDQYQTTVRLTSPGLDPVAVTLDQVAPGTYEADLGTIESGAWALRVDQVRDGSSPLARTLVLVAPTPAEYRLLGTNERLLAALRDATGGQALSGETAATEVWSHDVPATIAAQDLWPWLVILAMLLWPIDVGVRRLNLGRRDLAAARGWVGARLAGRGAPAARTATSEQMLATRDRAAGALLAHR
ncbi:MAG: VWA domain-containing protein [Chloroflexota bacterium]